MRAAGAAVALVLVARVVAAESPRDSGQWWRTTYGALPAAQARLGARAQAVFTKVAAVADKPNKLDPRLLLVGGPAEPFAAALPDGTVVLTARGLGLCYDGAPPDVGDARLAFVLGHELAHLARDHFWHAFAEQALRTDGSGAVPEQTSSEARSQELQADAYGIVHMVAAGFTPTAVVNTSSSFLEKWDRAVDGDVGTDERHPKARERADLLRAELAEVVAETDLFSFGVRMYQLGRYEDAIALLQRFRSRFPSREVLNDLALCHYQIALRYLAGCDAEAVFRFRLPTRFDAATLARRIPTRGDAREPCARRAVVNTHLQDAVKLLQLASASDPTYVPARLNLAAVALAGDRADLALAAAREATTLAPKDPDALNARAIARYVLYKSLGDDGTDGALADLDTAQSFDSAHAATAYNRAALAWERGQHAEARSAWAEFLQREPSGPHADFVRTRLGMPSRAPAALPRASAGVKPSISLGEITSSTAASLRSMKRRPVELGSVKAEVYSNDKLRVLVIGRSVEAVIEDWPGTRTAEALVAVMGPPAEEILGAGGLTLVYAQRAFDVRDGRVRRAAFSVR